MWSPRCNKWALLLGASLLEAACSTPREAGASIATPPQRVAAAPATPAASDQASAAAPARSIAPGVAGADASAPVAAATPAAPPPRATADFARAVALAKAGKDEEAELEFQQIATGYPAYPGALVNLGILYRKHGDLARSEESLRAAVQRDAGNAEGWSELGVTLRLAGKFHEAADAYNQAISVNPQFAPAYRNLAVVLDLYLGDTAAALTAMQRYKDLAADDKAVTGWIADLKQRAGRNAAPAPTAPSAPDKTGG
ncbi:MAG TPA: tetratricopeptide repeat protein [Steroidobacteraceae bacterium]|nr:tetratricopeptide repeat protein [Steroidobacteraceae bacterium]